MTFSLGKAIVAVGMAFVVGIVLVGLIGPAIERLAGVAFIGTFFVTYGFGLGLVAGIFYYFRGPATL